MEAMIAYTLWVYMPIDTDDQKSFTEVIEAVDKVSPNRGMDFESGERSLSFEYDKSGSRAIGRAITPLLKLPYVTRVSITRVT